MPEWERTEHEREALLRSLGLPVVKELRKTDQLKRALRQRQAWVPEKYAAKIREEVIDSVDELVSARCKELNALRTT